jgi:hypothetical protein
VLTSRYLSGSGPAPGLLAALGAWTWAGADPSGQDIAHILIAHPPGRTAYDTAETSEQRMRHIAASLGGMGGTYDRVPDLGVCLSLVSGSSVLLRFQGARFGLRLPSHQAWTGLLRARGEAVVLLGLDPLPRTANAAQVDTYLEQTLTTNRLLFGLARIPIPRGHDRGLPADGRAQGGTQA